MACFLKIVEPKKGNSSNFAGLFSQINLEIIAIGLPNQLVSG
jgi:hypothetical protein